MPPNKALELTGRRWVDLQGSPAGRPPGFGVDPPGGRRMGPGTLTGGRQLNAVSVRQRSERIGEAMSLTPDPARLFSKRNESYVRFVRFVRYPAGIRAYFLASPLLRSDLRVLDAGCGTGILTLALREALVRRGLTPGAMHAFDLTQAMLERFWRTLRERGLEGIDLAQADVLELHALPSLWNNYDLIVSASMLEYLPRNQLPAGLRGLRLLLNQGGSLVLFITRRNWLTRPLIGRWWQSNLYRADELRRAFKEAGFASIVFRRFPAPFRHFALWGHIVEAHR